MFKRRLFGGGIDGNEELTAMTGTILLVLLAVLGLTIVRIGQLLWLHLFLGLLLLGPVVLKLASTGYRFLRYYTDAALYRAKGPPMPALRAMGPVVVLSTLVVFVTGVILLFHGPRGRSTLVLIHKVSFIVWLVFMALHVLAHLPALGSSLRAVQIAAQDSGAPVQNGGPGSGGRWIALVGSVVIGAILAVVLIPHFGAWTAPGALPHHHHH
ncbi:MAG: hypothetical protein JO244_13030 [Solirubrobacterales bacterium]|nr:hypothetical protein [Solirubrobacterales bacterium]